MGDADSERFFALITLAIRLRAARTADTCIPVYVEPIDKGLIKVISS